MIKNWNVSGNLIAGTAYTQDNFDPNELYVTEYTDEEGNKTREYKDKLSRVVCKEAEESTNNWLATHYIYDDFGLLRCVVPPLAAAPGNNGSSELCYYYSYDDRRRMIEKQLPGAQPVYMVYDLRDRLAMVKDAENEWMVTLYDAFNRPVVTGEKPGLSDSRVTIQTQFDNYSSGTLYETWSETGALKGYSNQSIPSDYRIGVNDIKTVTWYDDYDFKSLSAYSSGYNFANPQISGFPAAEYQNPKGQVTAVFTRVESADYSNIENSGLLSVTYYDEYLNPIQVIADNHRNGKDRSSTLFDFTGQPEVTKIVHNTGGSNVELLTTYSYDHQGRLLTEKLEYGGATITLAAHEYSDLGEPVAKYLHGSANADKFNQEVNFKYNIKGWLTAINQVGSPGNDLFSETLHYEDTNNSSSYFNGNIWRMDWQDGDEDPQRFEFVYDGLSRVRSAEYADGSSFNNHTSNYCDASYTYDVNGNLNTLRRYLAGDLIDDLVYTYPTGSNQLQNVTDNGTSGVKGLGYKAGAENYSYDGNGNMVTDHNFTQIDYNLLNLPEEVTYNITNKVKHAYTATGAKLQKKVDSPTYGNKVIDYIGPFLYEDSELKVIFTSEGRLVKINNGGTVLWKYEYNLTDHLGNVRAVFAAHDNGIPELMQQTNYYPFGMVMNQEEMFQLEEVKNRYLYNGKELQDDDIGVKLDWYDYGARFYDPALARWHSVDALSENYNSLSSYNYVANNPIIYIDPNGMMIDGFTIDENGFIEKVDDTGEDEYDVLYTKNDYEAAKASGSVNESGNPEPDKQVKVDDTSILPELSNVKDLGNSKKYSEAKTTATSYDALNIFKFASDNSGVEWSLTRLSTGNGNKYSISTYHMRDLSPGLETLGISEESAISRWHSHPATTLRNELSTMGDTRDGSGGNSDLSDAVRRYRLNDNKETYPMNVYFPNSGNYYHVAPWGIKLKGNAR